MISQNQYRCFCLTMVNDEESYNITVTNDFPLKYRQSGAFVDTVQSPLLDEWGGSWTFSLNLPMPRITGGILRGNSNSNQC